MAAYINASLTLRMGHVSLRHLTGVTSSLFISGVFDSCVPIQTELNFNLGSMHSTQPLDYYDRLSPCTRRASRFSLVTPLDFSLANLVVIPFNFTFTNLVYLTPL